MDRDKISKLIKFIEEELKISYSVNELEGDYILR